MKQNVPGARFVAGRPEAAYAPRGMASRAAAESPICTKKTSSIFRSGSFFHVVGLEVTFYWISLCGYVMLKLSIHICGGAFMDIPWFLKPELLLHAEMLDEQEMLRREAGNSYARDHEQDLQIKALQQRVAELEQQLLALEVLLAEKGILPPVPQEPESKPPADPSVPIVFAERTDEQIACPRCGKQQPGNRNDCYFCGALFRYEKE